MKKVIEINNFNLGMNTVSSPEDLKSGVSVFAENINPHTIGRGDFILNEDRVISTNVKDVCEYYRNGRYRMAYIKNNGECGNIINDKALVSHTPVDTSYNSIVPANQSVRIYSSSNYNKPLYFTGDILTESALLPPNYEGTIDRPIVYYIGDVAYIVGIRFGTHLLKRFKFTGYNQEIELDMERIFDNPLYAICDFPGNDYIFVLEKEVNNYVLHRMTKSTLEIVSTLFIEFEDKNPAYDITDMMLQLISPTNGKLWFSAYIPPRTSIPDNYDQSADPFLFRIDNINNFSGGVAYKCMPKLKYNAGEPVDTGRIVHFTMQTELGGVLSVLRITNGYCPAVKSMPKLPLYRWGPNLYNNVRSNVACMVELFTDFNSRPQPGNYPTEWSVGPAIRGDNYFSGNVNHRFRRINTPSLDFGLIPIRWISFGFNTSFTHDTYSEVIIHSQLYFDIETRPVSSNTDLHYFTRAGVLSSPDSLEHNLLAMRGLTFCAAHASGSTSIPINSINSTQTHCILVLWSLLVRFVFPNSRPNSRVYDGVIYTDNYRELTYNGSVLRYPMLSVIDILKTSISNNMFNVDFVVPVWVGPNRIYIALYNNFYSNSIYVSSCASGIYDGSSFKLSFVYYGSNEVFSGPPVYKVSYMYDGFQEGPLGEVWDSGDNLQARQITVSFIPSELSKRITHINVYRSIKKSLYALVRSISLSESTLQADGPKRYYTFVDNGQEYNETYESRTGISQEMVHMDVRYRVASYINGYLFVGNCVIPPYGEISSVKEADRMVFRSKLNKPDMIDWANDYVLLQEPPIAIAGHSNMLFVFTQNKLYAINPVTMSIIGVYNGMGVIDSNHVYSDSSLFLFYNSGYGLRLYNNNNMEHINARIEGSPSLPGINSDYAGNKITCITYNPEIMSVICGTTANRLLLFYPKSLGWFGLKITTNNVGGVSKLITSHTGDTYYIVNGVLCKLFGDTTKRTATLIFPVNDFKERFSNKKVYNIIVDGTQPNITYLTDDNTQFVPYSDTLLKFKKLLVKFVYSVSYAVLRNVAFIYRELLVSKKEGGTDL